MLKPDLEQVGVFLETLVSVHSNVNDNRNDYIHGHCNTKSFFFVGDRVYTITSCNGGERNDPGLHSPGGYCSRRSLTINSDLVVFLL